MDVLKIHSQGRQSRINTILHNLQESFKAGLNVDFEKFVATCCLELNISRRTAQEYIRIVVSAKGYNLEAGIISNAQEFVDIPDPPKQAELPK